MPEVSFTIAQRTYTLRCAPGQEARLEAAAADLGGRVSALAARAGGGDDRQLLVIAALELIDALADARADAQTEAAGAAAARAEAAALRAWAGSVAGRLERAAAAASPVPPDDLVPDAKGA